MPTAARSSGHRLIAGPDATVATLRELPAPARRRIDQRRRNRYPHRGSARVSLREVGWWWRCLALDVHHLDVQAVLRSPGPTAGPVLGCCGRDGKATSQRGCHDPAGRADQQEEPEDIGHEAGRQQQRPTHDDQGSLGDLVPRPTPFGECGAKLSPGAAALDTQQPGTEHAGGDEERDGPAGTDRLTDLKDDDEFDQRYHDEQQDEDDGHGCRIRAGCAGNRSGPVRTAAAPGTQVSVPAGGPAVPDDLVRRLRAARGDPTVVLLEGVHALKHAVRFGADVEVVVSADVGALRALLVELAPDVVLPVRPHQLDPSRWRLAAGRELPSPALGIARRPQVAAAAVLASEGRIVVLEQPRHLGNLGAVVRVAAAAGAGGVLVVGDADPWHPTAVRAGAGLQFALPVTRSDALPETDRPTIALDALGAPLTAGTIPADAVLLLGTERHGLSPHLRARADHAVAVPMRPGVSSLNLATAVAVALYSG